MAAAITVLVGMYIYCTPVIAVKFPYLSKIFEQLETYLTFSGNYTEAQTEFVGRDDKGSSGENMNRVEDEGVTITAVESVSDGYSLYLTTSIVSSKDSFNDIVQAYTGQSEEVTVSQLYAEGVWELDGTEYKIESEMEGMVTAENIFVGMLKLDFPKEVRKENKIHLTITSIKYDKNEVKGVENSSKTHSITGSWSMEIPFKVKESENRIISIREKKGNIEIDQLVITPYQAIVYGNNDSLQIDISEEEKQEILKNNPNMKDEEFFQLYGEEQVSYYISLFTQDGEKLNFVKGSSGEMRFATNGKEINELHLLVFDNFEDWLQSEKQQKLEKIEQTPFIEKSIVIKK